MDPSVEDEMADREQRVSRALEAWRERRRRRRAEDTWFGSAELLAQDDSMVAADERARRRMDVVEEAQAAGISPELAEMLYDVAREEGVDPALAYDLVCSGLGVAPPADGIATAAEQPASDKYFPTWLLPASPPDDVLRERMLRLSLRRVRRLLEEHPDPSDALHAYAREPDVGVWGF